MNEQRDNSGALFKNDRMREGKNDPGYTGQATIAGNPYWISAWVKEGNGKKFFSLSFKPKEAPKVIEHCDKPAAQRTPEDDVPF